MAATRRLAAIMFTDMVGFTASAQTDEAAALRLLHEQEKLVRPVFAAHQGREIKSTGDGFLVEFRTALQATECAVDIQRQVNDRNARSPLGPIELRIGVHLGDIEQRRGDVFGDAVNVASRIGPCAAPGGICISGPVFDLVRSKIPHRLEKLEARSLKNVKFPVDLYRVVLPWTVEETSSVTSAPTGLAVLPFSNISPDPKDEYFADGLTEELITLLSHVRELRVIARTSVMQYKTTSKSVSQIGAELGVSSVLEGSVRKAGNRLRITAQLIDVGSQGHVWAASYDRELDDVFAIQTEVAEKTAAALRLELLGPQRSSIRKKPTSDLVAYDLYLRGIHAAHQPTIEAMTDSIRFFEEAIRKDPNFSLACASLANTYIFLSGDAMPSRDAFPRAKELIARALALDPTWSDAHTARGNLALQQEHNWALAELEFREATSLNPSNANAHFWYATLLRVVRRFGEAIEELKTTIELDPLWVLPKFWLVYNYYLAGDLSAAIASAEELRDSGPQESRSYFLGFLYALTGRIDEARKEAELTPGPIDKRLRGGRATLSAILGKPEDARLLAVEKEEASRTEYVSPDEMAALYAAIGEKERALDWLERGEQSGEGGLWNHDQAPHFDSIREEPRFQALLKKMNLV